MSTMEHFDLVDEDTRSNVTGMINALTVVQSRLNGLMNDPYTEPLAGRALVSVEKAIEDLTMIKFGVWSKRKKRTSVF